jgi:hypothetical protein
VTNEFGPTDPDARRRLHIAFIAQCRKILAQAAAAQRRRFVIGQAFVDAFWKLLP